MHFNRRQLTAAVTAAIRVIPKRQLQPILGCVLIQFHNNGAELIATDLDTWYVQQLPSGVATGCYQPTCIEARQLLQVLKSRKDELVLIANACGIVTVDGMQVQSYEANDYPQRPAEHRTAPAAVLPAAEFQRILDQAAYCAPGYSNGVLDAVNINDSEVVCTDGSRMSFLTLSPEIKLTAKLPALTLAKVVAPLVKPVVKSVVGYVTITPAENNWIGIAAADWLVMVRQVSGEYPRYPDYSELFPADSGNYVEFSKANMLAALTQLKPFLDKRTNVVRVDWAGQASVGENRVSIGSFVTPSAALVIRVCWLNWHYLTQAIESMPGDTVRIQYAGPSKPLVFLAPGFKHLLMPVFSKEIKAEIDALNEAAKAAAKAAAESAGKHIARFTAP